MQFIRTTPLAFALSSWLILMATSAPTSAQDLRLPQAIDYNPSPTVFETVLFAHEIELRLTDSQKKTLVMAYNGSVPGPTIDANLGDTLIVHFVNLLHEATTVHWHGVELPAGMDGSHISQALIPRFGYRRYEFQLNNAATYWYHPHNKTNEQIEKGLHGALIVRDPADDRGLRIPSWRERTIFLDDVSLNANYQISPFATDLNQPMIPWRRAENLANGRPGTHTLVNGQESHTGRIPTLHVIAGAAYRLRFINASSGETFRLSIPDSRQRWYQIGSDQGLWNAAELIKPIEKVLDQRGHHNLVISDPDTRVGVTLTPSDRIEAVLVANGDVGEEFYIEAHDFVRGEHVAFRDPQNNLIFGHHHFDGANEPKNLIRVKIIGQSITNRRGTWQPPASLRRNPVQALTIDPSQATLPVIFGHGLPDNTTGDVTFFAQVQRPGPLLAAVRAKQMAMPAPFGPIPMMKQTAATGYHVKVGQTRDWEVVNFTGGDHNFHLHGFRFQHLDSEFIDLDKPNNNYIVKPLRLSYEDTIRIPKRPNLTLGRSFTIVRVITRFDDASRPPALRRRAQQLLAGGLVPTATRSGGWLVHCHHLPHAARGMMSFVTVTK
jgi:FtsP/CotA-like multicopper oxidase with cupredoxin domain